MLDETFNKWLLVVFCVVEVLYVKGGRRRDKEKKGSFYAAFNARLMNELKA